MEEDGGKKRDKNRNKKRTFVPNRDREKKIIAEFILLLKMTEESANRKYSSKDVWDIVREDKITTKLILENESDRAVRLEYEMMTEEEKMLSAYAEEELIGGSEDVDDNGNPVDQNEDSTVEFNPSTTMLHNGQGGNDERGDDDTESERVIVKLREINLTKARLNMLAFKDIFRVGGEEEMAKKNYTVSRLRRRLRKKGD